MVRTVAAVVFVIAMAAFMAAHAPGCDRPSFKVGGMLMYGC